MGCWVRLPASDLAFVHCTLTCADSRPDRRLDANLAALEGLDHHVERAAARVGEERRRAAPSRGGTRRAGRRGGKARPRRRAPAGAGRRARVGATRRGARRGRCRRRTAPPRRSARRRAPPPARASASARRGRSSHSSSVASRLSISSGGAGGAPSPSRSRSAVRKPAGPKRAACHARSAPTVSGASAGTAARARRSARTSAGPSPVAREARTSAQRRADAGELEAAEQLSVLDDRGERGVRGRPGPSPRAARRASSPWPRWRRLDPIPRFYGPPTTPGQPARMVVVGYPGRSGAVLKKTAALVAALGVCSARAGGDGRSDEGKEKKGKKPGARAARHAAVLVLAGRDHVHRGAQGRRRRRGAVLPRDRVGVRRRGQERPGGRLRPVDAGDEARAALQRPPRVQVRRASTSCA